MIIKVKDKKDRSPFKGRRVAILGGGLTPLRGRWPSRNYNELIQDGVAAIFHDVGISPSDVEAAVCGTYNDIFVPGEPIPERAHGEILGIPNKRITRVTNGGDTGGHAIQVGREMARSGEYDIVLVYGGEKALDCFDFQSKSSTPAVVQGIGYSWDRDFEAKNGGHASDSYGSVALSYKDEYPLDLKEMTLARLSVLLNQYTQKNLYAQRKGEIITEDEVLHSPYTVYPIRKLHTCVYSEGAGGLILVADGLAQELSQQLGRTPIWLEDIETVHEPYHPGDNIDRYKILHRIYSDHLASHRVYERRGIKAQDILGWEIHDAFLQQMEITFGEFGVTKLGNVDELLELMLQEKIFANTSGGLTGLGHAVGLSNIASLFFLWKLMLLKGLKFGGCHGTGASRSQYTTFILLEQDERRAA